MLESLEFAQPGWLLAALVMQTLLATLSRVGPHAAQRAAVVPAHARRADGSAPLRAALMAAGWTTAAGLVGFALLRERTPLALLLLGALAVSASAWAAVSTLPRSGVGRIMRTALVGLRTLAWLAVLVALAQPALTLSVETRHRPALAVLMDCSRSMDIRDAGERQPSRADRANAELERSAAAIARIETLYDVRRVGVGAVGGLLDQWRCKSDGAATPLADALFSAREIDDLALAILISDGAETARDAAAVREAGRALAARGVGLVAIGVGPEASQAPTIELERLRVPPRVDLRERLDVIATLRARHCAGESAELRVFWDDREVATHVAAIGSEDAVITHRHEIIADRPGVHRVSVLAAAPSVFGETKWESTAFVDVVPRQVRVLFADGPPRHEATFILRALRADDGLEVTYRPTFRGEPPPTDAWKDFDVVIIGAAPEAMLTAPRCEELASAVRDAGVGLLFAAGPAPDDGILAALEEILPIETPLARRDQPRMAQFLPTDAGLRHPILSFSREGVEALRAAWAALPDVGPVNSAAAPRSLATVLATDSRERPLLVVQPSGAGRCGVALWERTWPWCMSSERGAELHGDLWRRLVVWLANRRPAAWVLSSQPRYAAAALRAARLPVRFRAGISGLDAEILSDAAPRLRATLVVRAVEPARSATSGPTSRAPGPASTSQPATQDADRAVPEPVELAMHRESDEWVAELSAADATRLAAWPGAYSIACTFNLAPEAASGSDPPGATSDLPNRSPESAALREALPIEASSQFEIAEFDVERQPPTANLALLREIAELGPAASSRYGGVDALPQILAEIANTDRRIARRVEARIAPAERFPAWLLSALLAALLLDITLRRWRRLP